MIPDGARLHVYGHDWAQNLLRSAVLAGSTSHAYLFAGPDQIGKTTLARALAQALTCEKPIATEGLGACGRCRACRLAAEGGHPDHRLIEPQGAQIKIEQVRDLIREATLSPIEGHYKVFIIRSFDRANPSAANALLKTLEEPTDSTRILLTSSQSSSLLATITSRCQVLHLRPLPEETVSVSLQSGWDIPEERANLLAGLSVGRFAWALEMATSEAAWQSHIERTQSAQALVEQDAVERLAYARKLDSESDPLVILRDWLWWWRDVLLVQQACTDRVVNRDQLSLLEATAEATQPADVRRFLEALMSTATYLRRNVNSLLALEALLLKVPNTT